MVFIFHLCVNALFLFVLNFVLVSNCEPSYSSIASLTALAAREGVIFKDIREFQENRQIELEKMRRKIEFIELEHKKLIEDAEDYLSNPINAFKLIKRLVIDWNEIYDIIGLGNTTQDFAKTWKSHMENMKLPRESDFRAVIQDLTSLENDVDGATIYGSKMTGEECYEIGIRLYDKHDYTGALSWLQQALEKMTHQFNDAIRIDITEYIAYSQYMLGDVNGAILTMEQVLGIPVANSTVAEARAYFLLNVNDFLPTIQLREPHYVQV